MENQHIKYPSTGQFRDVIKQVQSSAKYHGTELPVVNFRGTVKLHGTNAAIIIKGDGSWYCQSRERIITPESDNAGFAAWAYGNKEYWDAVAKNFQSAIGMFEPNECVHIYGEWCGQGVQTGVGISKLPKMFIVFAIRFGENAESQEWHSLTDWDHYFSNNTEKPNNVYFSEDFPTYNISIDFNSPTLIQNKLVEITEAVEKDCPVARFFLPDSTDELVGEGIVWSFDFSSEDNQGLPKVLMPTLQSLRFKVKGEKHSVSKVKTIAPVDIEKVKSIDAFVDYACTDNRLNQGISYLREMNIELSVKSTGDFIKWVMKDILKEELDTMTASGIEPRDINGQVSRKAREFYMNFLDSLA